MYIHTFICLYIHTYTSYTLYIHIDTCLSTACPSRMAVGTKLYHPNAFITTDVSETEFVKI